MSHSILPPSSAHIWGKPGGCRGWVAMQKRGDLPPDTDNTARELGTLAHSVAELILIQGNDDVDADPEILEAVQVYTDHVAETVVGHRGTLRIEHRVNIDIIHEQCYGTPDAYAYIDAVKTLYVWDYKHGIQSVEAFENWQCIAYAAGIIDEMGLNDQEITVCIVIVQPRAYSPDGPVKTWTIPATDLRPYVNQLAQGAREALGENPETRSGPHCRYCRARTVCTSAIQAGAGLYESVNSVDSIDPSIETLSLLYTLTKRAKSHIDAMLEGYSAQIEHALTTGKIVPGYHLAPKMGNRKWISPEYATKYLALLGVDATVSKLKSPAQIEKLIDKKLIEDLTERSLSGHKVTKDDTNKVRKIFS